MIDINIGGYMETRPIAITIRSKKLGVLIRGARQSSGKSIEDCSAALNISGETFTAYEEGELSPSLPELETLAFYLQVPWEHFWGREALYERNPASSSIEFHRLLQLRQRMVGALIRKARLESDLTQAQLADQVGLTEEQLNAYELGLQPTPVPELEMIANVLNRPIKDFQDNRGPVGSWIRQQMALKNFSELSPDLQEFISRPVNRPYLELAQRMSEMSVDKLRAVAEVLLEITL
jgi:transcriptional regulator with XRE-family HTH domain